MLVSGLSVSVPKWRRTFLVLLGLSAFVTLILHSKSGFIGVSQVLLEPLCPAYDETYPKQKEIFFVETSGKGCLTARQACSVESAARGNPQMTVRVYISNTTAPGKAEENSGTGLEPDCGVTDLLTSLPNVKMITDDLAALFLKTHHSTKELLIKMSRSKFSYQHLSDALRAVILHNNGGIYLDLDVIVLRSIHCLVNAAGYVRIPWAGSVIENGFLSFEEKSDFMSFYLRLMNQVFDPDNRLSIGPEAVTKAFHMYCHDEQYIFSRAESYLCHSNNIIRLLSPESLYPIEFVKRHQFYSANYNHSDFTRAFNKTYSVHMYGLTHGQDIPDTSLAAYLVANYCPTIYMTSRQSKGHF